MTDKSEKEQKNTKKDRPEISAVINLRKRKSETPLQTIKRYVGRHHMYAKAKMTYAGRLDPMAEGVLVVLAGEKNKERDTYTGLDKDYEFEFILGFESDTFDVLGKLLPQQETEQYKQYKHGEQNMSQNISDALKKYEGVQMQTYPPYSSKVVNGKSLFEYARKNLLHTIELPKHEVEAKEIMFLGSREIYVTDLEKEIVDNISAVEGDFRQKESIDLWTERFEKNRSEKIIIYKARLSCGSGFYVRQLVSDIGNDLGTGALTISIIRTRVGEYLIADSL